MFILGKKCFILMSHFIYGFALIAFVHIAVQLARGLEAMERAGVLHKNINPSNIVMNAETLTAKFIDFSSASQLTREPQQVRNLHRLEGNLAYMAPEQTGRMHQQVDSRTDMYALGVTFYQMLTGSLPFQSDNALEIAHAHLAVTPTAIEAIHPRVPRMVSAIIAKQLAKHPEERYQSAYGLRQDLIQGQGGTVKRVLNRFLQGGGTALPRRKAPGRALTVPPAWNAAVLRVIELNPHTVRVPSATWTTSVLATSLAHKTRLTVTAETVRLYRVVLVAERRSGDSDTSPSGNRPGSSGRSRCQSRVGESPPLSRRKTHR
jgi:serine/threonine protein kinase